LENETNFLNVRWKKHRRTGGEKREIERTVRKAEILRGMGDKRDITTISTEEREMRTRIREKEKLGGKQRKGKIVKEGAEATFALSGLVQGKISTPPAFM
jgi:hypothetical protein